MFAALTVCEAALPELLAQCKKANAAAWEEYHLKQRGYFQHCLDSELVLLDMERQHQGIVAEKLREETVDDCPAPLSMDMEEQNVWEAFQQVGPIPAVTTAAQTESSLEDFTELIPSFAKSFPYQGSKIWDWMGASRSQIEEELPELDECSEATTSGIISPLPSSTSSEQDPAEAVQSSASSDSGLGSEASGSTAKKMKKVDTPEEIKKRKQIVDEWKKKIQESM